MRSLDHIHGLATRLFLLRSRIQAEPNGAYQVFKPGIGADAIEYGLNLQKYQPSAAFFYSGAQEFESRIFLSQTNID
jgi:hypothetical protein